MSKFEKFMKAIFPEYIKCIICSKELNEDKQFSICDDCIETLPFIEGNTCIKCGMKLDNDYIVCLNCKDNPKYFERHVSVLAYNAVIFSFCLSKFKIFWQSFLDFSKLPSKNVLFAK